jgi:hypothetical protein
LLLKVDGFTCNFVTSLEEFFKNENLIKNYISLLPDVRTKSPDGTPFSLLNEIYSNIQNSLLIGVEAIEPSSQIILNKEISNIKTLCNLHCQSLVNSLRWNDIINMTLHNPEYDTNDTLNLSVTLVFVSSTEGVPNLNVVVNYRVSGFQL